MFINAKCILLLLLFFTSIGFSQNELNDRIKEASKGEPELSIDKLEDLLPLARAQADSLKVGMIYYLVANRYQKLGKYQESINNCKEAIKNFEWTSYNEYRYPRSFTLIGDCFLALEDIESSLDYYNKCMKLSVRGSRAYDIKNYAAITITDIIRNTERDFVKAQIVLDDVLRTNIYDSLSFNQRSSFHLQYSIITSNIGSLKSLNIAKDHLDKYLYFAEQSKEELAPSDRGFYYNQEGYIHMQNEDYENSLKAYLNLLNTYELAEDFSFAPELIVNAYNNVGALYILSEDYSNGLEYAKRALIIGDEMEYENSDLSGIIYDNIGSAFLGLKEYDSAHFYLDKSILILSEEEDSYHDHFTQSITNIGGVINALYSKLSVIKEELSDKDLNKLSAKDVDLMLFMDSLILSSLSEQLFEGSALDLKSNFSNHYSLLTDLSFIGQDENLFYFFLERSRGALMLEKWDAFKNVGVEMDDLYFKLVALKSEKVRLDYLVRTTESDSIYSLFHKVRREELNLKSKMQSLLSLDLFKYISLREIQNASTADIIYYQIGLDSIYGMHITNSIVDLKALCSIEEMDILLQALRKGESLAFSNITNLNKVYNLLITPFNIQKAELKIVPDGILNYLPFESLIIDVNSKKYLIEEYDIIYTVSLALDRQWSTSATNEIRNFNVVSPIYDSSGMSDYFGSLTKGNEDFSFKYLKYTNEEISLLGNLYESNLLNETEISKPDFFNSLEISDIFHFTGHAVLNPDEHRFSFLALGDKGNQIDNIVTISEINEANSKAQLVMLNACNTGRGKILNGEGVFNLSRAFFRAGAKSVVNSLWSIDDQASSIITISFYKYLKEGHTKSRALRQAKLDYLASDIPEYKKHPYYWAGLVLVGSDAPLHFVNWYDKFLWPGGLIILALIFFLVRRAFQK